MLGAMYWLILLWATVALLWLWLEGRLTVVELFPGVLLVLLVGSGGFFYAGRWWGWGSLAALAGFVAVRWHLSESGYGGALRGDSKRLRKRIEEDPTNAVAWAELAEAQQHLRRYREALRSYEEAAKLDPRYTPYQRKVEQIKRIIDDMVRR